MVGRRVPHSFRMLAVLVLMLATASTWALARSVATVSLAPTAVLRVDTHRPGNDFEVGAVGLSTEATELGTDHLSAAHHRLVRLMRLLGPSVLRIGGNSVDLSWWTSNGEPPPPWATNTVTPADLRVLQGLLSATGWRVLLGVDLGHFEPARVADEARFAQKILGAGLLGIEIGNEPNDFGGATQDLRLPKYSVSEYLGEAEAYRLALSKAAPGVAVDGPALTQKTTWLTEIGAATRMFTELTQHAYPINTCSDSPPLVPQPTANELLSPAVRREEDETLKLLTLVGAEAGRPTRMGETNSVACGSSYDANPAFAGGLWSLDWVLRAVSSGVRGLNFHGTFGSCGSYSESPICALGNEELADDGDVTAQPTYYGLLAARQLEGGRFVKTQLIVRGPQPDLTTWATLTPGGTLKIAIDNFATKGLAQPVSFDTPSYAAVDDETLIDLSASARDGIALGATSVTVTGGWRPRLAALRDGGRSLRIIVRPASAVIVTFHRRTP